MTTEDSADRAEGDDLTRIKGIGPARRKWLAEAFAVRSFADLAALSVDQIEDALKEEKQALVTRSDIEDWLAQAQELAAAAETTSPEAEASPEPTATDDDEPPEPDDADESADTALPTDADILVRVTDVRICQPADARPVSIGGIDQVFSGIVRKSEPFALEVDFDLAGSSAEDLTARRLPYICQFYVRNLANGASLHLGDSIPATLAEGRLSYRATLFFAKLPEGAYRLQVLVILQSSPPVPGHLEVPILQVL